LKEQLAQTLAASVTSILTQPRGRIDAEGSAYLLAQRTTIYSISGRSR
jgi:hypothetical protein